MKCPRCGSATYLSAGKKQICPNCGYGSSRKAEYINIHALIRLLYHEDVWVRKSAAQKLGQVGDERAIVPLLEMRFDKKRYIPREDIWEPVVELDAIVEIAKRVGDVAIDMLIKYLPNEAVIGVLGDIGNPLAVDALRAIAEDPAIVKNIQPKHFFAMTALGEIGGPSALSTLEKIASQDPSSISRDGYGISGKDFIEGAREAIKAIKERETKK